MTPMTKEDPPDMPPNKDVMWYAKELYRRTPYIYDTSRIFWMWRENHYAMVDKTDMMSMVFDLTVDPKYLSGQFKAAILEAIQITGRKAKVKPKPKEWIHFENCIIDLKTWEKIEPDPQYHLTLPIPHKFQDSHDTPTIDKLFRSWVDEKYVKTLYEVCAYCLLDDYPIHRVFLLFGEGRNGKGQYRDILTKLVGEDNTTAITLEGLVNNRFESSRLYKKKMCSIGETNFKAMEKTSMFKMATGGDPIPAEFKRTDQFTFRNTAKMIINTNSLPQTKDKTDGFYSRWVILNFENQFLEGEIDIINTIPPEEYNALVSRSILTLKELLSKGSFHEEGDLKEKMLRYEAVSNPLQDFIEQYCTTHPNDTVPYNHFKKAFTTYLSDKKLRKYTDRDMRGYIASEGYYLSGKYWFNDLKKQMTAILGVDLINNPEYDDERVNDGSLDDFQTTKTICVQAQER